ncbi:HAMP domain-containing sensor histidine kinase [Cyanobium gracile]|nr:HAMP domain-containing sensor histidine kinase [Cyanobium gracile]
MTVSGTRMVAPLRSQAVYRHRLWFTVPVGMLLAAGEAQALTEGHVPDMGDAVFYTFFLTAIAFSAAIIAAYQEFRWLVYVLFSLLLLLSVASQDGTLAHLLGGGPFVLWVVPYLCLSLTTAFGYLVVVLRIEAPHPLARLRPLFGFLALLTTLLPLSSALWLEQISLVTMWKPLNLLFFAMLLAQALPPLTWSIRDRLQRLLTRTFPVVVGGFAIALQVAHLSGEGFSQPDINQLNRLTLLLFALFSLAIVIWQVVAITREKIRAERQTLEAERNEARLQLALAEAEADYQQALSTASRHRSRLATVSHDLKQPVAALRHAVDQMQRAGRDQDADTLSRAVDYVASLAHAYTGDHGADPAGEVQQTAPSRGPEVVACGMFARTLEQMFAAQALEQNVRLRIICPDTSICVEPLATMRIMANLMANALAHAESTRLLIGFMPRGSNVVFQVHDDGVGMDAQMLARVSQQGFKGADSKGDGLGLSIVQALCRAQGMAFDLRSTPGRGTSAFVALPRHLGRP